MLGLPQDAYEATCWFRAMESATHRLNDSQGKKLRDAAAAWLRDNAVDA